MGGDTHAAFLLPKRMTNEAIKAAPTGTPGKKMTRVEAARHASLVRWKKEQPFAANVAERLAQIRAARAGKGKKKGGGGKGKAKGGKPKDARTSQEKANQNRAAISKETGMADLEGPLVRIGAGMSSDLEPEAYDKLIKKGLAKRGADGKTRLTPAGKKFKSAADKGDADGARAALADGESRAAESGAKDKAKADKKAGREKAKAERLAKQKERKKKREKKKAKPKPKPPEPKAEAKPAPPAPKPAPAKRTPKPKPSRRPDPARRDALLSKETKTMDELEPIISDIRSTIEELTPIADTAIKAGRRNASGDQAKIDEGYELAMQLCDLFEALGADTGEEAAPDDEMAEVAPIEGKATEYMLDGGAVKSLADGAIGAYAVRFGSEDEPDMSPLRDYFTKSTDFWLDAWDRRPMLFHHAMDEDTEDAPRIGTWTKAEVKDEGVWLEGQLDKAHRYYGAIKELVRRGVLRLSSDSAPHLVRRAVKGSTHEVTRWPLLAASLTPTPAEPRLTAVSFKALVAELGLNDIPDNPEVQESEGERPDEVKAQTDRARRLLLELELSTLEATIT